MEGAGLNYGVGGDEKQDFFSMGPNYWQYCKDFPSRQMTLDKHWINIRVKRWINMDFPFKMKIEKTLKSDIDSM